MKKDIKKPVEKAAALIISIILVANIILFSLGKITAIYFWLVIAAAAVAAYIVLPYFRKK